MSIDSAGSADGVDGVDAPPGAESSCTLRVQNDGMVVDRVLLEVLGESREWATVEPDQLSLLPAMSESARILFHPPRSPSVRAGDVPFAVRAVSLEDPEGSVVEEGVVRVGAYADIGLDIVPRTSQGRRSGKHRLTVENRGNQAAEIALAAADPDDALEFRFTPDLVTTEPGTATFVKLRAAPRKRFLKGPNKSLPFQAMALREQAEPATVDASVLQRQTMPEWLLPAAALLAAACAVLVALWYLLLKPAVHSAATQAVSDQTRQLASNASQAGAAASRADAAASGANSAAVAAGGGAGVASGAGVPERAAGSGGARPSASGTKARPSSSGSPSARPGTSPVSTLLQSDVAPGANGSIAYRLPAGWKSLTVSDVVVQNPAGDSGTLHIQSGGSPLFDFGLADFRNLDYHFVQPLVFSPRDPLTISVDCRNSGATHCTAGLSFSGQLRK